MFVLFVLWIYNYINNIHSSMNAKIDEKQLAIKLRKKGFTYGEILRQVPVAKSTLSLWLRSVGLALPQKQRITEKRIQARLRGASARRQKRILLTKQIYSEAGQEIGQISRRELWLIGAALYWAEGNKQKEHNVSQDVKFSNSDPLMIKIFLKWLLDICKISIDDIKFEIYLHETNLADGVKEFWAKTTGFGIEKFQTIYWKKNKINTKRKNKGENYNGLLRIKVKKSTNFNREIAGWCKAIYEASNEKNFKMR